MKQLIELEEAFWDAAGDGQFYDDHIAADGLCVLPVGTLEKDATVEAISQAGPWQEYTISNMRTIDMADHLKAVSYQAAGKRAEGGTYNALVTTIYRETKGVWELLIHQQTPIDQT